MKTRSHGKAEEGEIIEGRKSTSKDANWGDEHKEELGSKPKKKREVKEKAKEKEEVKESKSNVTSGVYLPPFKRQQELERLKNAQKTSTEYQKFTWEELKKSINGIVNKVNVSNISNIILELFNENLIRGKGLLAKAIIKS